MEGKGRDKTYEIEINSNAKAKITSRSRGETDLEYFVEINDSSAFNIPDRGSRDIIGGSTDDLISKLRNCNQHIDYVLEKEGIDPRDLHIGLLRVLYLEMGSDYDTLFSDYMKMMDKVRGLGGNPHG